MRDREFKEKNMKQQTDSFNLMMDQQQLEF